MPVLGCLLGPGSRLMGQEPSPPTQTGWQLEERRAGEWGAHQEHPDHQEEPVTAVPAELQS